MRTTKKITQSPDEWRKFKLIKREKLTPNTDLFRFEVPKGKSADLPTASCLTTRAVIGKKADGSDDVSLLFFPRCENYANASATLDLSPPS